MASKNFSHYSKITCNSGHNTIHWHKFTIRTRVHWIFILLLKKCLMNLQQRIKKINTALRDANYLLIASTFQRFVLLQYHFRLYKKSRSMPTANDAQSAQISLSISQLRALSLLIQEVSQNSTILFNKNKSEFCSKITRNWVSKSIEENTKRKWREWK